MKWVILFVCLIPTLIEAYLDRNGEDKKGKKKDTIALIVVAIGIALASWGWFGQNPLAVLALILGWRILAFDYITHALLKKYSLGHKGINWFTFSGTTAFTDKLVSKVHPVVRLAVRILVFAIAVLVFLLI